MQNAKLIAAMATLLTCTTSIVHAADADAPSAQSISQQKSASAQGAVLLTETFDTVAKGELPAGWRQAAWNVGTAYVEDGSLIIDGRKHGTNMTAVLLPESLETLSNYRIDVRFSFDEAINATRWGSVMYRTSAASNVPAHEPYFQFAIRKTATANNGLELAYRNKGGWQIGKTKAFTEDIDSAKIYTATVVVHGNRVRQYLNGLLVIDEVLPADIPKGGIGLQTAGLVMRVDSIQVTEQTAPLPEFDMPIAVQDTGTQAAMAPTLVQPLTSGASLDGSGVSSALLSLDSALNLKDASGTVVSSLQAYFAQAGRTTIPLLRIQDDATVDALEAFSSDVHNLADLTLLSGDVALLKRARTKLPRLRTAVDFTARGLTNSAQDLLTISGDTHRAGAKIAVLPAALVTRDFVGHLQRLFVTVWASADVATNAQAAAVLATGVNGVVSHNSAAFADVLRKLPANTLLRKPLVVGHRGMPARFDENTLESAKAAVEAGADAVENDIYITTDDHLVIMHDETVNRTTNGVGRVEDMTLADVKALRTKTGGYKVPTMREYFKAFKDKPITHVIELKSSNPRIIAQLKKEMAEEGVADQSVAISFYPDQLKRSTEQMPELAGGILNKIADSDNVLNSVRNVLEATQANSSTFNPDFGAIRKSTMEAAKHRGTTFWPWTLNNATDFYKYYSWGTHGITTDHAYLASNFPVDIVAKPAPDALKLNQALSLDIELTTQVKQTMQAKANELVYLGGTATMQKGGDGSISFSSAGTAVVMPGYRHNMDATYSYVIVGQPVSLVVGDGSGGVVGIPNSANGGSVSCSSAVPGQSSACEVAAKPGYQLIGVAPGSTCPAGAWNAERSIYTTGLIAGNCEVRFDFAALPVQASLGAVGKAGAVEATVQGGGSGLWAFDAASAVSVKPAMSPPQGVSFPFGVVSLQLVGGEAGMPATVEMTYPEALPANAKYYKFGKTAEHAQDHWYEYPNVRIEGNKVLLTLTDGQTGDDDLSANGVIRDPGGVAVVSGDTGPGTATATPVPGLGQGALMLLSAVVGCFAWLRQRRSSAA
ncbi:MAG: IPTL-CTERM sorting domain-containing protein [Comamonas sp.]